MGKSSYLWVGSSVAMLVALTVAAVMLPRSFALIAVSDVIQSLLLISGTAAFIPLALHARGRIRLFYVLITLGVAFWLSYQLYWTYYEVVLRRDVPDLCTWDIILFLHIVPFMAALAVRPHVPRDEYAARIGQLDFALLLIWWFYLYVLVVMPWQYVLPDLATYNRNLNYVYAAEKSALLAGLIVCWITSKGSWRRLYGGLFGMSLCYSASSTLANWAIDRQVYYSGSLYDIPLVIAMTWLTWIGVTTKEQEVDSVASKVSTVYGVWIARLSMIAVFSLPIFAAWSMADVQVPPRVRTFRLALTLVSAFLMGSMAFLRQRMLDKELFRLLGQSRNSFDSLKRLQAQILQSEKLASIAQLVGGAAHELNNPITAMLGYSELLLSTGLTPEQQPVAAKIGQYVRRTRSLVASLISFARQSPAPKAPVDLNTLARTALKLAQPQWEAMQIEIRSQFEAGLPKVHGDSNQLLQVCLQLLANSMHVLSERGGRVLIVSSQLQAGNCVLHLATEATNSDGFGSDVDSRAYAEDSLALSACQGILHEHRGTISSEYQQDGAVLLRMELPALDAVPVKTKDATVPVLWQSRPSV